MTRELGALRAAYLSALRDYLEHESEAGFAQAYELGRQAMIDGMGLLDMSAVHRTALDTLVLPSPPADQPRLLEASSAFFNELLAPFELSIEGYRAALAASEERFQLAVSGAMAGLWDWNPQTDEIYFSPHFKRIMGYEDSELPNEREAHFGAIDARDVEHVTRSLTSHLEHRGVYDVEYRIRTKVGETRWVQSRGQALWNDAGVPYRMVGWILDITDRKRNDEALRTSREEMRRLSAHVQHVREEEKARIARELHDDLGQQLTALKMAASMMEYGPSAGKPRPPQEALRGIYEMIDELVRSVRHIAADLHPVMLDDLGLIPAVENLVDEFSARYRIQVVRRIEADTIAFKRECRIDVFRMVQEALTNVARHSGASEVRLEIAREDPHCIVRVVDNGRGAVHDGSKGRHSFGLLGMRERAALLGGEIQIITQPGAGFALTAILPLASIEASNVR
ncbi:PAS domain-containing protein [Trinickia diaoshuihuensis]|uniref:PAS domain-containing protein n=1 Tax=Trinickia diaoshuihuensis TaxID=2292265 RepID=UPI000E280161|nr:PAS domain-containing protein [Trinickia diaoshuihuensis]